MTARADWLEEKKTIESTVMIANNERLNAISKGKAKINMTIQGQRKTINIEEVLHVPKLATNLLSVSKIAEKRFTLTFNKNGCLRDTGGNVVATATLQGGVYKMQQADDVAWITHQDNEQLWHRRFGHLNQKSMRQLENNPACGIPKCSVSQANCETCIQGKSSRLPFVDIGKQSTNLLDLVHSDLCGPMSIDSIGGAKYFLTFIDDCSRKKFLYFIREKNQVLTMFIKFKNLVENQTNQKIKALRTDNGREYINTNFKNYLEKCGIVHQTTTPYTPEQNGVAERANRSIVEKARTMLLDANLNKKYWAEATNTATYLLNRSPTKTLKGRTPEEIWRGDMPNLKHLRVFGCEAMVHIPSQKRGKWDPKAEKLILIGYAVNTKGYRLINTRINKVTVSRNVIFLENKSKCNKNREKQTTYFNCTTDEETNNIPINSAQDDSEEDSEDKDKVKREENEESEEEDIFTETTKKQIQSSPEHAQDKIQQQINVRRSERKTKPVSRAGFISYYTVEDTDIDPLTIEQALNSPDKDEWVQAMRKEYTSLIKNDTWEYVKKPENANVLTAKWVFKRKPDKGENQIYKARLVVRGCAQKDSIDHNETYSPVVKYSTIRYLLSLAVQENLDISHMDVTTAYLNRKLEEDVYVKPPKELSDYHHKNKIWKLKKAIYGLKQSGRAWNKTLDTALKEHKLQKSKADPCVYIKTEDGNRLIVTIYVDDLLIFSDNPEETQKLKNSLKKKFDMKDLGEPKKFLGMNIERDRKLGHTQLRIYQKDYIQEALNRFRMSDCNPVGTPMEPGSKLEKNTKEDNNMNGIPYMEAVGSLLYLSQISRPDIAFAVNVASTFSNNPNQSHWNAVKRIFRYLKGTLNYNLTYSKSNHSEIITYSDADWANDPSTRRSVTGTVFIKNGGAITWFSKRQRTVALSSVEAEYIALAFTCQEGIWIKRLITELEPNVNTQTLKIFCDSRGAISLAKNAITSQRSKHIDVRWHFIRDHVENDNIEVKHLSTDEMSADILTKPLNKSKIKFFCEKLGLLN